MHVQISSTGIVFPSKDDRSFFQSEHGLMDMKILSRSSFATVSLDDWCPVETCEHVKQAVFLGRI